MASDQEVEADDLIEKLRHKALACRAVGNRSHRMDADLWEAAADEIGRLQAAAAIPPSGEAVAWLNPHNGAIASQQTRNNTVPLYAAPPAPVAIDEAMVERLRTQLLRHREVEVDAAGLRAALTDAAALNPQPNGGA